MNPKDLLQYLWSALSFILMLTVLVAVHEYGHFIFARMFGMRVKAFAVFIGGIRSKGVAEGHFEGKMVPAAVLWGIGALSLVVMALTTAGPVYLVAFATFAFVLPCWICTRIAALYHFSFAHLSRVVMVPLLIGIGLSLFRAKSAPIFMAIMLVACWISVLVTYYQPVLHKEEGAEMGLGNIDIDGNPTAIPFRPIVSTRDKAGTEFALLTLPLGGFAAIDGMEPKEDGSEWEIEGGYFSKRPFPRFMVIFAGPLFSFLLGSVLLTASIAGQGRESEKPSTEPVIGFVAPGKEGDRAGLQAGDRIISVDAQPVKTFFDVVSYVRERPGSSIRLSVERGAQNLVFAVTPDKDEKPTPVLKEDMTPSSETKIQGKLGVLPVFPRIPVSLGEAAKTGFRAPFTIVTAMIDMIRKKPQEFASGVGGITSVAAETHNAAKEGPWQVVFLAGMLSISLGMMNVLPIFPLDGGRMLMTLIEWVRGNRRIDLRVQNIVSTVGVLIIMLLMIVVTTADVGRFGK